MTGVTAAQPVGDGSGRTSGEFAGAGSGVTDLTTLLATMSPKVRPGRFVFVSQAGLAAVEVLASVVEDEGPSAVVRQEDADRLCLRYDFVAGWITLTVHSSLAAVGLTAAVSVALAERGIACNVIAGFHHDHLLVAHHRVDEAVSLLRSLAGA